MAKVQITDFKGIMPKVAKDKLPSNMAQVANDLKTTSGDLVAFRRPSVGTALPGSTYQTFFEYLEGGNNHWVYYDGIVHWVRSPIANDNFERMYFTGKSGAAAMGLITFTDGMTDAEIVTVGAEVFEFDISEDGVVGGRTAVDTGGVTTAVACAAALALLTPGGAAVSFTDNLDGTVTVTADDIGFAGNLVLFSSSGAHITTTTAGGSSLLGGVAEGSRYGREDGQYSAFVNDLQLAGTFDFATDFYNPGAPAAAALDFKVAYTTGGTKYRAYFYTYVSRYGEEGPPSAILETVDSNGTPNWDGSASDISLDGFTKPASTDEHLFTPVDGNSPALRIYRSSTDGEGNSAFLLVAEVAINATGPGGVAWATYSYDDDDAYSVDGSLGATCTTTLYDRAPDGLTNLRGHPNGFYVASKGNVLYFSEPFAPWAWPTDYQIPLDSQIIGLGVHGSTIVVATDGNIYTFAGPHPTTLYKSKLSFQPCLSQRAVVETDDGVMFPSLEGFQHVTSGGVTNATAGMFKPEDWVDFELETMHGTWYNKAYYGFYKTVDHEGHIILDILNGAITTGVAYHQAGHIALLDGTFRTIYNSNLELPLIQYISTWDNNYTQYTNYSYKSPLYIFEKPVNFKVAQVILDSEFYSTVIGTIVDASTLGDLNQDVWDDAENNQMHAPFNAYTFNGQDFAGDDLYNLRSLGVQEYINFRVWVNGSLVFTKQIRDSNMFKLPRGFKDKKWEFGVDGMIPIKRIIVATSTEEIV